MIRAYFGLKKQPFSNEQPQLLERQQSILDTLRVHSQQGGLCLLLGEPGTGKSTIKQAFREHDAKRIITPTVSRFCLVFLKPRIGHALPMTIKAWKARLKIRTPMPIW